MWDLLVQDHRISLHGQRSHRPQELTSLCMCGDVHSHLLRESPSQNTLLPNGENILVYSSLQCENSSQFCFEAQTSTNHAFDVSQHHTRIDS